MHVRAILIALAMTSLALAGCSEPSGSNGGTYEGREVTYDLFVASDLQGTVELYRLNNNVDKMRVVAMGFQMAGQEELIVPNPEIRIKEGDTLIINVENLNQLPHTFHIHGNLGTWLNDGVPFINDLPIHQGESRTYRFAADELPAGTYFYHCHVDVAHHMDLGMVGALIVEEVDPVEKVDREFVLVLDEWDNCHVHGNTDPVDGSEGHGEFSERAECLERFGQDRFGQNSDLGIIGQAPPDEARDPLCDTYDAMPDGPAKDQLEPFVRQLNCDGGHFTPPPQQSVREWYPANFPVYAPKYNTFTLNGKAFPDTQPLWFGEGERVKMRFINVGEEIHSMHIHGHNMKVVARDAYPLASPFTVDTLGILPGERYDVIIEANNPGLFPLHDHVGLNVMNDYQSPGGIFTLIAYEGDFAEEVGLEQVPGMPAIDLVWQIQPYLQANVGGHDHTASASAVKGTARTDYWQPVFPSA